jgi:hypothetical protein
MSLSYCFRLYTVVLIICVTGLSVFSSCNLAKGAEKDPLWQKAVAIAEANKGWAPQSAVLRIEILNKRGEVEHKEEALLDFTSKSKDESSFNSYVDPNSLNIVDNSPFEPESQNDISLNTTPEIKDIEGKQCVKYEYIWRKGTEVLEGTAWLEKESGIPVKIESSPRKRAFPQPFSRRYVTVVFRSESSEEWFPEMMTMEISAGLFTLGRVFRITVEYRGYERTESPKWCVPFPQHADRE